MKAQYAKTTVQMMLLSLLALLLVGCGQSGSSGGSDDVGETAAITMETEAEQLQADGSDGASITITMTDSVGAAVAVDTAVRLETNLGHFRNGEKKTSVSTPDDSGKIVLPFTAGTTPGTAVIVAKSNGVREQLEIELVGQVPAFIEVADGFPNPASITIKGTGGQSSSQIVFNVNDSSGNPVIDGYRVNMEVLDGPEGGERLDPATATTLNGQVSTSLRSGTKAGPVSVKATYAENTNVSATTSQIAINAGPPVGEEFGVFAQYLNISGLELANLTDQISVNVGDVYGNSVPDGTAISFKTYNTGGFFEPNSANTESGLASNILHSGGTTAQPTQGFLTVTAEANNGGRTTHVTDIEVDPVNNNILYAGTDGGGVYKSTDSGKSWTNMSRSSLEAGRNFLAPYVNDVAVKPDDPDTVYAGTGYLGGGNIYRSVDGGSTWKSDDVEEFWGLFNGASAVLSVVVDTGPPRDYYVWAGTDGMGALFAENGEDFRWGGKLTTAPYDPAPANSGEGELLINEAGGFGPAMKTETWTATYQATGAMIVSGPTFDGSDATGVMEDLSATGAAGTQTWTVTYSGGKGGVDESDVLNRDYVELTIVETSAFPVDEVWRVTCVSAPNVGDEEPDPAQFRVIGSKSGVQGELANANQNYTTDGEEVTFYIEGRPVDFTVGDEFVFETKENNWNVRGSVSGRQSRTAKTGEPYDNGVVSFLIDYESEEGTDGNRRVYESGDTYTFETRAAGSWQVEGSKSGIQQKRAQTNVPYTSDNGEVAFTIFSLGEIFQSGDDFEFEVQASGLGFGKIVRQIAQAYGHADLATLYAATATGVFKTVDGGLTWEEVSNFARDNIKTLAVHPENPDVVYAGTQSAGVWYTTNAGADWSQAPTKGLGEGLGATDPLADAGNEGTGTMSGVSVSEATETENWTVTYDGSAGEWAVEGTLSGVQSQKAETGTTYTSDEGVVSFTIHEGEVPFADGDRFTFSTTRDPGTNIEALQVYASGGYHHLYAATYFQGESEPNPVGNVYGISLEAGSEHAPAGTWEEANKNLPQYDPPADQQLFPQHAMAVDNPDDPGVLYIGGEGINFYKATSGLSEKSPEWFESKAGLSNLIMARMPILFTDDCNMEITSDFDSTSGLVTYTVYIQDPNGNPPIAGSVFTVILEQDEGDTIVLRDIEYPDTYTYAGTFRNPADPETDNPYVISTFVAPGDKVTFTFTPTCTEGPPGCSGQEQTVTYRY